MLAQPHISLKDATTRPPRRQVLESSRASDCPLTFEVGAGDIMGNKLFQGFDEAVRGLAEGDTTELEVGAPPQPFFLGCVRTGGAWASSAGCCA